MSLFRSSALGFARYPITDLKPIRNQRLLASGGLSFAKGLVCHMAPSAEENDGFSESAISAFHLLSLHCLLHQLEQRPDLLLPSSPPPCHTTPPHPNPTPTPTPTPTPQIPHSHTYSVSKGRPVEQEEVKSGGLCSCGLKHKTNPPSAAIQTASHETAHTHDPIPRVPFRDPLDCAPFWSSFPESRSRYCQTATRT
ncbi:unnamed protein product [Protopolystoma xenopodis]|uniref:Uncharacterized protein n=1 Tax=Protopolystoma xenopodis TaxID=117903 RepID=A0A3S5FDN3_9PLAT|nr:unnamed protein product [Protopolystoma xenopodis]